MKKAITTLVLTAGLTAGIQVQASTRIIGGSETTPGTYPWMVSLHDSSGQQFCGASLVAKGWVLTAAHCVENESPQNISAVVGNFDLNQPDPGEIRKQVNRIVIHPKRGQGEDFDIALLQLESPARESSIHPASPALFDSLVAGTPLLVMGWGNLSTTGASYPERLHQVLVPLVSQQDCQQVHGSDLTDNMVCAGLPEGGKDACQGDSGGPLLHQKDSQWYQVGIVSWGDGCAQPNSPGVYTKVSAFEGWIRQVMNVQTDGGSTASPGEGSGGNTGNDSNTENDNPPLRVSTSLDFTAVDQEPVQQQLTVTGDSDSVVSILDASVEGNRFEVVENQCQSGVARGEQCNIEIQFNPGSEGFSVSTLRLETSDGSMIAVELYGESLNPKNQADSVALDHFEWWEKDQHWVFDPVISGFMLNSGEIASGHKATLKTEVVGPGILTFDFSLTADSEQNTLTYFVDGKAVRALKGNQNPPGFHSTELSEGVHQISWVYAKRAAGSGKAGISHIRFQRSKPEESKPLLTSAGSASPLLLWMLIGIAILRRLSR